MATSFFSPGTAIYLYVFPTIPLLIDSFVLCQQSDIVPRSTTQTPRILHYLSAYQSVIMGTSYIYIYVFDVAADFLSRTYIHIIT